MRALQARSPSSKSGGHGNCGSEDLMSRVCHIILQTLETKGSINFMGSAFKITDILQTLVTIGSVVGQI